MSNNDSTPQVPEPPRYGQRLPEGDSAPFGNDAAGQVPRYGQQQGAQGQGSQAQGAQGQSLPTSNPYGQNPYGQNAGTQNTGASNAGGTGVPQYPGQQAGGQQNPYGQNPYGQNQPGQAPYGANPYGQPGAQQGWNSPLQQGGFGAPVLPPKPKELNIAAILLYVAAVLTAIGGIALMMIPDQAIIDLFNATPGAAEQLDELEKQGVVLAEIVGIMKTTALVLSLIFAVLYAVIGFFIGKGSNGARITGTVLAVISVFTYVGSGFFGWIMLALGVGAIVLAWLRPSSAYITAKSAIKRSRRG